MKKVTIYQDVNGIRSFVYNTTGITSIKNNDHKNISKLDELIVPEYNLLKTLNFPLHYSAYIKLHNDEMILISLKYRGKNLKDDNVIEFANKHNLKLRDIIYSGDINSDDAKKAILSENIVIDYGNKIEKRNWTPYKSNQTNQILISDIIYWFNDNRINYLIKSEHKYDRYIELMSKMASDFYSSNTSVIDFNSLYTPKKFNQSELNNQFNAIFYFMLVFFRVKRNKMEGYFYTDDVKQKYDKLYTRINRKIKLTQTIGSINLY